MATEFPLRCLFGLDLIEALACSSTSRIRRMAVSMQIPPLMNFFPPFPWPLATARLWKSCAGSGRPRRASPFGPSSALGSRSFGALSSVFAFPHFVLSFSSYPPFLSGTAVLLSFSDVLLPYEYVFAIGFRVPGELDFLRTDRKDFVRKVGLPWGPTLN